MKCHSNAEYMIMVQGQTDFYTHLLWGELRRKLSCFELLNKAMRNLGSALEEMRVACGKVQCGK